MKQNATWRAGFQEHNTHAGSVHRYPGLALNNQCTRDLIAKCCDTGLTTWSDMRAKGHEACSDSKWLGQAEFRCLDSQPETYVDRFHLGKLLLHYNSTLRRINVARLSSAKACDAWANCAAYFLLSRWLLHRETSGCTTMHEWQAM